MSDAHDPLVRAVGSILQRGTYGIEEIEALRAAAADKADIGNCQLAGLTIAWLMQQFDGGACRADTETVN